MTALTRSPRSRPGRRAGDRPRRRWTLSLLVLSALTLVVLDGRGFGPVEGLRSAALTVLGPVGGAASGLFRPLGDAWSGAADGAALRRENEDLRRRVEELQGRVAQDDAEVAELARLRRALDLPHAGGLARVTAQVTAGAIAEFDATVELDKGADAGIARGMPVVVDAGLVGSVVQVSGGRSVVRLVTDRSSRVGVTVAGAPGAPGPHGLVQGRGSGPGARATDFDTAPPLPPGALLVTAGTAGSLYPPGIPVGTVTAVETDEGAAQQVADVRLAAPVDTLSFVTVLLHRAP